MDNKNLGIEFENKVHKKFFEYNDQIKCYRELDIKRMFGSEFTAIDHMLETKNKVVFIQDKWLTKSPKIEAVNSFMNCVNKLKTQIKKPYLAIYATRKPPTTPAIKALHNDSGCYVSGESMSEVITNLFSQVMTFLEVPIKQITPENPAKVTELEKVIKDNITDIKQTLNTHKFVNSKTIIDKIIIMCEKGLGKITLLKPNKIYDLLIILLLDYNNCSTDNHKYITKIIDHLFTIVNTASDINRLCKDIIYDWVDVKPLEPKLLLLAQNFGIHGKHFKYGKTNWNKLIKYTEEELKPIIFDLNKENSLFYKVFGKTWFV